MDHQEPRKAVARSQILLPRHVYKRLKIAAVTQDRKITDLLTELVCVGLGIDPADHAIDASGSDCSSN